MFGKGKKNLTAEILADLEQYIATNYVEEIIVCNESADVTAMCDEMTVSPVVVTPPAMDSFLCMSKCISDAEDEEDADENAGFELEFRRENPSDKRKVSKSKEASPRLKEDCEYSMPAPGRQPRLRADSDVAMAPRSLDDVVINLEKSFMEMVFSFADAKGISDLELRKKAEIDKRTFSKLKCGTTRTPSKNTALALAIALELNLDETKDLLARAGMALSPCSKSDLIVQYFIEHEAYDIYVINDALYQHGEAPLGSIA